MGQVSSRVFGRSHRSVRPDVGEWLGTAQLRQPLIEGERCSISGKRICVQYHESHLVHLTHPPMRAVPPRARSRGRPGKSRWAGVIADFPSLWHMGAGVVRDPSRYGIAIEDLLAPWRFLSGCPGRSYDWFSAVMLRWGVDDVP